MRQFPMRNEFQGVDFRGKLDAEGRAGELDAEGRADELDFNRFSACLNGE